MGWDWPCHTCDEQQSGQHPLLLYCKSCPHHKRFSKLPVSPQCSPNPGRISISVFVSYRESVREIYDTKSGGFGEISSSESYHRECDLARDSAPCPPLPCPCTPYLNFCVHGGYCRNVS